MFGCGAYQHTVTSKKNYPRRNAVTFSLFIRSSRAWNMLQMGQDSFSGLIYFGFSDPTDRPASSAWKNRVFGSVIFACVRNGWIARDLRNQPSLLLHRHFVKSVGVGIELFSFCKTNDDNYHCLLVAHARLRCLSFLKRNTSAIGTQSLSDSTWSPRWNASVTCTMSCMYQ